MKQAVRGWRLVRERYSAAAFDGEGARLCEGRWNPQGVPMVYASECISLALLETLVHSDFSELSRIRYVLCPFSIPSAVKIDSVSPSGLPSDWTDTFPFSLATQEIGRRWIREGKHAVLSVPSVIVPLERNYLLNPSHEDMKKIVFETPVPFRIDKRFA